jgi:hypothetical protein
MRKMPISKSAITKVQAAVIVVIIVVVASVLTWLVMKPSVYPWLFKGAYAKYYGETTVLFVPVKLTMRLEVAYFNETHAKLLTYVKMESAFGSQEFQNVTWSDLTKKSYEMEGLALKRTYEQEIYIENFGTRKCVICEFESKEGGTVTMYIDKETNWPIKMKFSLAQTSQTPSMSIDLTLTETNIPELKK